VERLINVISANKWYIEPRSMMKIGDGSKPVAGVSDDDNTLVVQQVKEAGVTLRYPMLAENNYGVWAFKMKIFMRT
jgi:hypothetical protein